MSATAKRRIFPIGVQNFEKMRKQDNVYVDKTALIYQMANTNNSYFLSRPRRFGKSLLVSTLQAYFEGKKELFEGLAMEKLETTWTSYPVLLMSFALRRYNELRDLHWLFDQQLREWEGIYACHTSLKEEDYGGRFLQVIQRAYEQTGKPVVVLIDEYDSPLLDASAKPELQTKLRDLMRGFFSPLKDCGKYLRFLFLTGITKFSQLSIFSELNNLQNISMLNTYGSLCGITEKEMLSQLQPDIRALAEANGETYEEACKHLKRKYDGYHFAPLSEDVYNPFSLINVLSSYQYENYWYSTGTPTFLVELLREQKFDLKELEGTLAKAGDFDRATDAIDDAIPVLYQGGYLTIKGYNKQMDVYTLGYPNEEVRMGFMESLLPSYMSRPMREGNSFIFFFIKALQAGDMEECLLRMQAFFAAIPNDLSNKTERDYQTIFYLLCRLMGVYVETEVKSAIGRADLVMKTEAAIYVFEFKLDGTPEEALAQIDSKQYAIPYQSDGRPVVKIGACFSSATRTLGKWKVEKTGR
jgi:hypothetical protein